MKEIEVELAKYYSQNLESFGPGAKGVGWRSIEAQQNRFLQLSKILKANPLELVSSIIFRTLSIWLIQIFSCTKYLRLKMPLATE